MKKNQGITLITLIVTIVILLILIGISVTLVVNSSIIGKAKDAADQWNEAKTRDSGTVENIATRAKQSLCEHEWSDYEVTTEATCSIEGVRTSTCSKCGKTRTQAIPTIAHTYGAWTIITDSNDADYGKEKSVCSVCNHAMKRFIIGATIIGYNPTVGPNNEAISTSYTVPVGSINNTTGVVTSGSRTCINTKFCLIQL